MRFGSGSQTTTKEQFLFSLTQLDQMGLKMNGACPDLDDSQEAKYQG